MLKEYGREVSFSNRYEELIYLKYSKSENYSELYEELFEEAKDNINYMQLLYNLEGKFNLFYNMALKSEESFYSLIKYIEREKIKNIELEYVANEFLTLYPESKHRDEMFLITLKNRENEEKLVLLEERIGNRFKRDLFLEKIKVLEEMEDYLLVEENLREYIKNRYEDEEIVKKYVDLVKESESSIEIYDKLDILVDKTYLVEYVIENSMNLPDKYIPNLIEYYFLIGNYDGIYNYKDYLSYDDYYRLVVVEEREEYLESARKKYSKDINWLDIDFSTIYFNSEFDSFDLDLIAKFDLESEKSDVEKYYLLRYYIYTGNIDMAYEYALDLKKVYAHDKNIVELFKQMAIEKGVY